MRAHSFLGSVCTLILVAACSSDGTGANAGAESGDGGPGAGGASTSGAGGKSNGGGGNGSGGKANGGGANGGGANGGGANGAGGGGTVVPPINADGVPTGNPDGHCDVPADGMPEDVSTPTTVIGTGTADSCKGSDFVAAVAKGGVITFDCGPDPVTITLTETAKVFNDKGPKIVIDGGGKVTLSGGGAHRILYMNTCDEAQVWTTSHCQDQDTPQLTVQNITFADGNSKGETAEGGGGGAIFDRGGRLKIVNARFFRNVCDDTGPDLGGAAVRALSQSGGKPVYVVNSTFGGKDGLGNVCSNGGGLSSIGVSYTVINGFFSYNQAIGNGANPAKSGTPGGGSGGAIYNDGNTYTLSLCGTLIEHNHANEGGGAIFYVSNDRSGSLVIQDSTLRDNPSDGFETQGYPGIFVLANGDPQVTNSTLTK
ncbi:MAG TPA: hypothetical protein VHE30_27470 [Polyangiaceae bacterium]|nr:hypothetical protein [Polyangiaceae bacterium]